MFAFHFVAIGPFLAEIWQIPYLTLNFQGQGHDENRPKSNQVIYWSGPAIVPKMKEIQNVVQQLLHEQMSAAGSRGGAGVWTGTKTLSHPRYTRVTYWQKKFYVFSNKSSMASTNTKITLLCQPNLFSKVNPNIYILRRLLLMIVICVLSGFIEL